MFRVRFVKKCKLFSKTQVIVDEIIESIEANFGNVEEAWISRAKIASDLGVDSENKKGFMVEREKDDFTLSCCQAEPFRILNRIFECTHDALV